MDYIHRLPFILGALMSIIAGTICFKFGESMQNIYMKMAITLVAFFSIGIYLRSTILRIIEENDKKAKELAEKEKMEAKGDTREEKASIIDYRVDDYGEDFSPLKISDIINSTSENEN